MSEQTPTITLHAWMHSLAHELRLMTQAWQKLGAERLVVIVEEAVVYSSDDDLSYPTDMPMLKAPWRIDETLFW